MRARRLRSRSQLDFGQLELALSLGDVGFDLQALGLLLGDVRLGSRQLRLECDGIHLGDDLTGMDHVPLVDEDRLDPARLLGGHVHLDRLDPPIACGKPGRQRVQSGLVGLPTEDPAPGEEGEHEDPERFPLHRGRSQGSVELTTLVDVMPQCPIYYPAPFRGQQGPGRFSSACRRARGTVPAPRAASSADPTSSLRTGQRRESSGRSGGPFLCSALRCGHRRQMPPRRVALRLYRRPQPRTPRRRRTSSPFPCR